MDDYAITIYLADSRDQIDIEGDRELCQAVFEALEPFTCWGAAWTA